MHTHDTSPPRTATPDRLWLWANVLWTQCAWFAAVLAAAHGLPGWGYAPATAVLLWHLYKVEHPAREALLIVLTALVGTGADALVLMQGVIAYAGAPEAGGLPPLWITALWAVFATSLNVTLRWLQGRWYLSSALGAVAGPMAFTSASRLGATSLTEPALALLLLALEWGLMLPALCALARRLDGASAAARSIGSPPNR